jgi:hypothetical protein
MVMGWNWKESDRMESFGSDIEDLDIPSGSLMRHRENKGVEAREEGGENGKARDDGSGSNLDIVRVYLPRRRAFKYIILFIFFTD